MENIINYLVFIVSTTLTFWLGKKSKQYNWNEILPIPTQNFLVGLIVFVITTIFCFIMKIDLQPDEIFNKIILSIGGSGFATLSYDASKSKEE